MKLNWSSKMSSKMSSKCQICPYLPQTLQTMLELKINLLLVEIGVEAVALVEVAEEAEIISGA